MLTRNQIATMPTAHFAVVEIQSAFRTLMVLDMGRNDSAKGHSICL